MQAGILKKRVRDKQTDRTDIHTDREIVREIKVTFIGEKLGQ